jgi:predicted ribosome quality control (RQC) complex YloA/Tae2 family protein
MFKLLNSSGITESGESEKVLLLMESGVRLHTTAYVRDKSNTPSGFTLKLRKHIRTRRLEDVRQLGYDRVWNLEFSIVFCLVAIYCVFWF